MNFKECNRLKKKLSQIKLRGIEEYNTANLTFRLIYLILCENYQCKSVLRNIIMIFFRCITDRNHIENCGNYLCYCSRPMTAIRKDHLTNFLKVCSLINSKVVMYGTKFEKINISRIRIRTIILPFIWSRQLKKCIKNRKERWTYIRDIYSGYIDLLELQSYELKDNLYLKGILVLEETIPSSQLLILYLKNKGVTSVTLSHGLFIYDAQDELNKYYLQSWICDYILVYSKYAADVMNELGGYKGQVVVTGMYHFINSEVPRRTHNHLKTIGVFLEGSEGAKIKEINLSLINTVVKACEVMDMKIYVKLHPSNSLKDLEFYKNNVIKSNNSIHYFLKQPTSLELESKIDFFVCSYTTCLFEALFQSIPSFLFDTPLEMYKKFENGIYFRTPGDLRRLIKDVKNGTLQDTIGSMKDYLCGSSNPKKAYQDFFESIGWN